MQVARWTLACALSAVIAVGAGCTQNETETSGSSGTSSAPTQTAAPAANSGTETGVQTAVLNAKGMH